MSIHQMGVDVYRASTAPTVVAPADPDVPFFLIEGSSTKVVKVHKIVVSGMSLTAVAYLPIICRKYSTASSGGTATALTAVPIDSKSPTSTANILKVFTVAPTAGTSVGVIDSRRALAQATTAAAAGIPNIIEFDFKGQDGDDWGPSLRGTGQGLGLEFGIDPASAVTMSVSVVWSEEPDVRQSP